MVWAAGRCRSGEADESGADLAGVGEFVEFPAAFVDGHHVHLADQVGSPGPSGMRMRSGTRTVPKSSAKSMPGAAAARGAVSSRSGGCDGPEESAGADTGTIVSEPGSRDRELACYCVVQPNGNRSASR